MQQRFFILYSLFLIPFLSFATGKTNRISRQDYIALHTADAENDMKKTGVPASITLAQALLESEDGNSTLAIEANNHFGIKCAGWSGSTYTKDDDRQDECFRKYNSMLESYDDHSNFLRTRDRYAFLFKLDITDYKGWAKGLKKAGYATNNEYAERLIRIIEDNHLNILDGGTTMPPVLIASAPVADSRSFPVADTQPFPVVETEKKYTGRKYLPSSSVVDIFAKRKILSNNGVDYIIAKKGDTFQSLAKELELGYWQLPKYNEMDGYSRLNEGQIVYIKPKTSKTSQTYYVVKEGETIHSIAQDLGIKSKFIYKWNKLSKDQEVQSGQKLWLQKQKG